MASEDHNTLQVPGDSNDGSNPRGRGKGRFENSSRRGDNKRKRGAFSGRPTSDYRPKREQVRENRDAKRRRVIDGANAGQSFMSVAFTADEIAAEERRPKRKVAVLIGYAGTGYHGLQINHRDKTIEGDIFTAFVKAGAISKANADDPKKSSFTRCARTDRGVHAAGNVLSLKLIIEKEKLVEELNGHLPPQIRIWGIQRTANSFSAYQACESRWYEYLLPSYALLPPHPQSFLAKAVAASAKEKGVEHEYAERLDDVKGFWDDVEKNDVEPILGKLEPDVRTEVLRLMRASQHLDEQGLPLKPQPVEDQIKKEPGEKREPRADTPAEAAVREIKAAVVAAKRRYRVTEARLQRLQQVLNEYVGTKNYHNYTVAKPFRDPSAKRHMKSFDVNPKPIPIRDTEWLSLKVHGQSFMMHQIRKMVAMAVMVVRCGSPLSLLYDSFGPRRISIPKAPSLGLMLERPMFPSYGTKAAGLDLEPIDFSKYDEQIQEFKDREIYSRMFETEEKENAFHQFFQQLDNFKVDYFLWVTAGGVHASHERSERSGEERIPEALQAELGDDEDDDMLEDGG
ncbi:hypothetical protein P8C59_000826 [Phyllachora maydis]|uniref:tRNA pseudouridine synthase 1 n=1 Tax=Phyllachora maydis TaxID=1825666 RepID=A0AAD9HY25_9PEZI|nr:hypothetical protein P8C59_000826 [Phyllachora maydis]